MQSFKDRERAGQLLGERLRSYKFENPLVLAIPRGGVPVGFEVAKILQCPLDLLLVKKIGAPTQSELAVGAVSEDAHPVFNDSIVKILNISPSYLKQAASEKTKEIQEQIKKFRGSKKPESLKNKTVILVDDGIATGATIMAAIQLLKQKEPLKIVVAAPTGAQDSVEKIQELADEVICLITPQDFTAVGIWYENFKQVSDEEVLRLMENAHFLKKKTAQEITIRDGDKQLFGDLTPVENTKGLIIFAHGSGSSRKSPRNQFVAKELNQVGFSTLLFDLLTENESKDRSNVFDLNLLARRLLLATDAGMNHFKAMKPSLGYFGASTGAGAALVAAAQSRHKISAIVSRGGRPDMADQYLSHVDAPTLLIVGGEDPQVLELNRKAAKKLKHSNLVIVPEATHLFEEPGALEEVVEHAASWFREFLPPASKHSLDEKIY
jgi:putative phosphoribosyl transferase